MMRAQRKLSRVAGPLALCSLALFAPAFAQPTTQPTPARREATPDNYSLHRSWTDVTPRPGRWEWTTPALDGYPVRVEFYPSQKDAAPLAVFAPDYGASARDERLLQLIRSLRPDLHSAVISVRGSLPDAPNPLRGREDPAALVRNYETSRRIALDYWTALAAVQENAAAMRLAIEHVCFVAGDFHSNLALTEELPGVSCIAALSPDPQFFYRDMRELVAVQSQTPVLLIESDQFAFRLAGLQSALARSQMLRTERAGRGFGLLYDSQPAQDALRRFLLNPQAELPAPIPADKPATTQP